MIISDEGVNRSFPLVRTSFCISGEAFNPNYLTEQFHISPTVDWSKGELRQDRGENRYYEKHSDISPGQYTFSHWRYSTEYEQVYDVMQSVSLILEVFEPLTDKLLHVKSYFSPSYKICIAMKRVEPKEQLVFPGMILSRKLIEFAGTIGAEISLDFEGIIL